MKVVEMTTNAFWKGELGVKGLVEDDGTQYQVRLYVKGSQVNDYSCSCSQGNSSKGMCPHAKLVLKIYLEQADQSSRKSVSTSQEVRTMIREYTNREVSDIISAEEEEKVEFLPRLLIGRRDVKLEFKLGRGKKYVVKDLVAFASGVEHGSYLEYGKNLAFHHNLGGFTEDSQPLVEFVLEIVNSYLEHYEQFQRNSFGTVPALRELNLSKANRDRFFNIMMERTLELEDYLEGKRTVALIRENPEIEVEVAKTGRDGIKVSISGKWVNFQGERYLYMADWGHIYQCKEDYGNTMRVFLEQMIPRTGTVYEAVVNEKDIPLFYERVLKKIESYGTIHSGNVDLESYRPEELKAKFSFDSLGSGELSLCPILSYGDFSFHPVEDEKLPRTVCRDVPGEFRISRLITKYFKYKENESENLVIRDDDESMYELLTQGMEEFMSLGEVYLSDSFKKLRILPPPKVSIGVNTVGKWLELTVDAGEMSGSELNKILTEYNQKKRYYRLKNGEFLQLDDEGLMTVARLVEQMGITKSELQNKKIMLPQYRALYLDSLFKDERGITLYRDQLFKAVVRGMKSVEDSDFEIPKSMGQILRLYQKNGFRWLKTLDQYGFGGILADDMGLGKTIQVLAVLVEEAASGLKQLPSLIICPASLVYNWENEINKFAPELKVHTVVGTAQEREYLIAHMEDCDVAITSYDLLKRDIISYQGREFRFQIIDEAQYIKNAVTQSAKAVKAIQAQTRFALTGTPIENRLSELWSIFDYLMPGFLFGYQRFKKEYESPVVKDQDEAALRRLHRMIGPFVLRRLKQDVLKELPEKLETVVYSKFEKEQKELYTANALVLKNHLDVQSGTDYRTGKLQVLAELTKLRQICCDPQLCYENYSGGSAKLETCIDLILNGVAGGHKILLFSQFTSMLEIIGKRLEKEGVIFYSLIGSTSKENRLKMVNSFQKDETPVFLISLKAGGTGLNLTAADIVIHYDPWWNVAAQNQATDRTHRIGQEKQVSVFKLITKNTIEENILKLQDNKKSLAEQIITEGTISLGSLSKDDLLEILQ